MGKLFTKPENSSVQKLTLSEFYGMKQSKHALYQSKISNKSTKDKYLVKKIIPFGDQDQQIHSYLAKLSHLGQYIQGQNLFLPVFCQIRDTNEFCTDYKNLIIYYQDYDVKVKQQIIARKKQYQHFSEEQVWYILYSIVNALRRFQRFKLKSGKLNTKKILLNDKGHLKIINQLTAPENYCNMDMDMTRQQHNNELDNFYAPQQLQRSKQNRYSGTNSKTKVHHNVCQTFSLGIILLEVTTFIEGDSFYDMKNRRINTKIIQKGLHIMNKLGYSRLLQSLVRVMLSNHNDRPLPSQIYSVFKPYQKYILNLQKFGFELQNLYNSFYPSQVGY